MADEPRRRERPVLLGLHITVMTRNRGEWATPRRRSNVLVRLRGPSPSLISMPGRDDRCATPMSQTGHAVVGDYTPGAPRLKVHRLTSTTPAARPVRPVGVTFNRVPRVTPNRAHESMEHLHATSLRRHARRGNGSHGQPFGDPASARREKAARRHPKRPTQRRSRARLRRCPRMRQVITRRHDLVARAPALSAEAELPPDIEVGIVATFVLSAVTADRDGFAIDLICFPPVAAQAAAKPPSVLAQWGLSCRVEGGYARPDLPR